MWLDEIRPGESWMGVWQNLIHCGKCRALMRSDEACSVCGNIYKAVLPAIPVNDGARAISESAFQGAISWPTHVLLEMMRHEWERPLDIDVQGMPPEKRPSPRAIIVILFWTLFEGLVDTFMSDALNDLPGGIRKDILSRYRTIGSRLDRLYRIIWATTFWQDLADVGFRDQAEHLQHVQKCRNLLVHGATEAVDDKVVWATIENLQRAQRAWIAAYNLRCVKMPDR